jgi:hypothetical protein
MRAAAVRKYVTSSRIAALESLEACFGKGDFGVLLFNI